MAKHVSLWERYNFLEQFQIQDGRPDLWLA